MKRLTLGLVASAMIIAPFAASAHDLGAQPSIAKARVQIAANRSQCEATKNSCRARCPAKGNPKWSSCVTKCGEAYEHCLGY